MNYLYNGVELPALPEWDKTAYPYVAIDGTWSETPTYRLYCTAKETTVGGPNIRYRGQMLIYRHTNGSWVSEGAKDDDVSVLRTARGILWANHDIVDTYDDSILLAASDPVPVNPVTIDPASMTLGWLVGRRIAAQRKRV